MSFLFVIVMAKDFAKAFYDSREWKECRSAYIGERILIDGGRCELCHKDKGYIIHHKVELNEDNIKDPAVALGSSNLMYVCHDCHNFIHSSRGKGANFARKPARFDASGQIVPES